MSAGAGMEDAEEEYEDDALEHDIGEEEEEEEEGF